MLGEIRITSRSSSFITAMKISIKPLMKPPLDSGNTIRLNRVIKPAFSIWAASSSSTLICIMLAEPARLENGRFLTTVTRTRSRNEP